MKILLMSHTGLVSGGAEQCLMEYVDVLTKQGHKCKVLVPSKGDMTAALSKKGIDFTTVGYGWATRPHRKVAAYKIMASTGNSLTKIFHTVEKFKPDVIVVNTAVIPWGLYAGKAFGIPTVLLVHEILSDKDPSLNMVPDYQTYGEILNKNTDYVVYNSQFVKDEFKDVMRLPKTSKNILYPLPPLDAKAIDHFFRKNTSAGKVKIAIFGALSPRKNQMEALQAVKLLCDQGVGGITLDLYGDTEANVSYTKTLRRFIRENSLSKHVKIKGFATNVYEKMNEYNVVLNTATYEPFGRTIIEGQLFGRVVITNSTGGGLELVQDKSTGLVYESKNPKQLAEKIMWVISNEQKALEIAANAKSIQFKKYVKTSRYDALLEAVEYFSEPKPVVAADNIFDPIMCLFQYNHQLNRQYKFVFRLFHNRVTRATKNMVTPPLRMAKKTIKQIIS